MAMRRGPKKGKAAGGSAIPTAAESLGKCPSELTGLGRDLWKDACRHLKQTGRSFRVYRTPLRLACRLVDSLEGDSGINRLDAARRWLHELGLTTATLRKVGEEAHDSNLQGQSGRARILSLIAGKAARK